MTQLPGVFCLENSWADDGKDLTDKTSVEQQLRMLESAEQIGRVIHRDVATTPEFNAYMKEWLKAKYRKYPLTYMSFHGYSGGFSPGGEKLSLAKFAELIGPGKAKDRIFYFGSCQTMKAKDQDLSGFCKTTGAKAIVGYTRTVEWCDSAGFDCLLLPRLLFAPYPKTVYNQLSNDYSDLVRILGLRMATNSWVTPQKVAAKR